MLTIPIVIAARTILALQTIPSREVKPGEMSVVTVGYIHAGTKNNIIPDQAELGLTVRTYKADIRKHVLEAIARITKAEAEAAGAPREPTIEHYEATDAVYNDPALAQAAAEAGVRFVMQQTNSLISFNRRSSQFPRVIRAGVINKYDLIIAV